MNYQKLTIVGNATVDAKSQKSKKGDVTYTSFSVGVSDAKGNTTYFPVVVFGKHGEAVAKYVTKGRQVLVEGRIDAGENGRFNVVANRVLFGDKPKKTKNKPATKKSKK